MITDAYIKLIMKQVEMIAGLSQQVIRMLWAMWTPYRGWTDHDLGVAYAARSATTLDAAMKTARLRERAFMKLIYKELDIPFPKDSEIGTLWSDNTEDYDEFIDQLPVNEDVELEGPSVETWDDLDEMEDDLDELDLTIQGGVDVYPRKGVTPLDVWQRPLEQYRYAVSQGQSPRSALETAMTRVAVMAETDLSLARRDEIRKIFMASPKVIGYRRIIHPELSETGTTCGLCIGAADRVYRKRKLLPIHNGCNCSVLPITKDSDPGRELNDEDLQRLYEAAGGTGRTELQRVRVSFTEHGELGPIISRNGDRGKQGKKDKPELLTALEAVEAQLHTLRKSAEGLRARARKGEDVALALTWQNDRIQVLMQQFTILKGRK